MATAFVEIRNYTMCIFKNFYISNSIHGASSPMKKQQLVLVLAT
jgi:hypothetical protein